ncbi:helix-turn-helix domain-containing protein [Brevibacillus dissolubilis]|uniref:helix-turn-helix domain-containing protein n=1 Tax=Brevibacillus dissolubilis TaxID=1844116 RepID=UPI00111764D3|nr:helix-turn-helix transcriptional regulator [Brevibacillus dissolubilis]
MKESKELLINVSIGDIIRKHREQSGLSLSKAAALAGISKSVLSRIENNEINRPEIKTIKAISKVLPIPYSELLEYYVEVENRTDVLKQLLNEVIELAKVELVKAVVLRLIFAPYQDTDEMLKYLIDRADADISVPIKITLYQCVVEYSKKYNMNYWLAKSLFQKYLVERNDFSRLKETYQLGKEIIFFINYLSPQEKPIAYWKLGLHAYNLKLYEDCIELCQNAIRLAPNHPDLMRSAILAIVPSAFETGDYEKAEKYLDMMEQIDSPSAKKSAKFTRGIIYARRGKIDTAIPMLEECFDEARQNRDIRIVLIANELLDVLQANNHLTRIDEIFGMEREILAYDHTTPFLLAEVGKFYKRKGLFHMNQGEFEAGIRCFLDSMSYHEKVSDHEGLHECTKLIHHYHYKFLKVIELPLLEKLDNMYNNN